MENFGQKVFMVILGVLILSALYGSWYALGELLSSVEPAGLMRGL